MLTTMKVIADMLWVMAPARAPQARARKPVPGPPTRGPSQPTGRQCLQVLREEPHPHDEEAKAACDPCEEFVHACVDVAV